MSSSVISSLFFNLFSILLNMSFALMFLSEIMCITYLLSSFKMTSLTSLSTFSVHNMYNSIFFLLNCLNEETYWKNRSISSSVGTVDWYSIITHISSPFFTLIPAKSSLLILGGSWENSFMITSSILWGIFKKDKTPLSLSRTTDLKK